MTVFSSHTLCLAPLLLAISGCTFVGQGEGEVHSEQLVVSDCWFGAFELGPDFFAAVPYRDTLQVRLQHGSDLQEVSDGVAILVHDVPGVRAEHLGLPLRVGLAPELISEVAPNIPPQAEPPDVSLALYLQFSCHNQNVVLYAIDGSIVFEDLFSGDPNESVGAEKLTNATFDVTVADLRDLESTTQAIPDERTSPLSGYFRFHFQRGQPGQPFP